MRRLDDFIVTVPGVMSGTNCAALISDYAGECKPAQVEGGKRHPDRHCSQFVVPPDDCIDRACAAATVAYREIHGNCRLRGVTNYVLVKYGVGQFYKQHCDSFPGNPRELTISIALNDDFEGGEWAWFDRGLVKRFKRGDAVMFPSNFMFPHEILPVTRGARYALIAWFTA
jgi:hypothetical protein